MKRDKWYLLMILPSMAFICFFIFYPLVKGSTLAFQEYNLFNLKNVHFNGLNNFKAIISNEYVNFGFLFLNTLKWMVLSLIFQFLLGFLLAMMLRSPFKGRSLYCGFVFYPWALCGFSIGLIWSWLFNGQFGVINDLLMRAGFISENIHWLSDPKIAMYSVITANVWYGIPYFGIMLLAALQSVPNDLYEAATLDGCGSVKKLLHVTLPYIKPTIVSTVLLRSMWIVNFPDLIYAMTNGGPVNSTHILGTMMINKIYKEFDYGQASAYGVVIMLALLLYAIAYLKLTKASEENML
ncbi:MAG: carbohydrate ABC transporter permease [Christensenellales bacterium]|jgi:multiple sugar transport system permease protein